MRHRFFVLYLISIVLLAVSGCNTTNSLSDRRVPSVNQEYLEKKTQNIELVERARNKAEESYYDFNSHHLPVEYFEEKPPKEIFHDAPKKMKKKEPAKIYKKVPIQEEQDPTHPDDFALHKVVKEKRATAPESSEKHEKQTVAPESKGRVVAKEDDTKIKQQISPKKKRRKVRRIRRIKRYKKGQLPPEIQRSLDQKTDAIEEKKTPIEQKSVPVEKKSVPVEQNASDKKVKQDDSNKKSDTLKYDPIHWPNQNSVPSSLETYKTDDLLKQDKIQKPQGGLVKIKPKPVAPKALKPTTQSADDKNAAALPKTQNMLQKNDQSVENDKALSTYDVESKPIPLPFK